MQSFDAMMVNEAAESRTGVECWVRQLS